MDVIPTPKDRQSAKDLVESISKEHGHLSDEKLKDLRPELRREIQEAFLKKDLMIGSSTSDAEYRLSKNLYTSKARFVFELLQNADDNSYEVTKSFGLEPFVSFQVYPRRIVVECNEDGFTHENLSAICSVGQSSKKGAQGYIGEKGIGFKSVFMAAWKVHIQSGAFSFFFVHKPGGSGMGMISPIWGDADEELPPSPLTRITLYLHETGDEDAMAKTRQTIESQFEELQETFLLFMKNLRKIHVTFHDEMGERTSSASYSVEKPRPNYAVLRRSKSKNNNTEDEAKYFHVTTHEATNLAKNDNRTYSDEEEYSRAYSKSQVILAFPLTQASEPIVKPQDLFVFLPVRPTVFPFLIQADFVTDAARQDIVRDSLRNLSLLGGVADAFIEAVLQFCQHDTLRYQWMRYLPDKTEKTLGTLWTSLIDRIETRLRKSPVLEGRLRPRQLRLISDMYHIIETVLDDEGNPLFEDIKGDRIISSSYAKTDENLLISYGLKKVSGQDVLDLVRQDLAQGANSRMHSRLATEGWHERAARLIHQLFTMKWQAGMAGFRELSLLPLDDGTWASASSGTVYFAHAGTLEIPPLRLRLISKNATTPNRKILFTDLGVQEATTGLVRELILRNYPDPGLPRPFAVSLTASKRHLKFLYLSHHLKGEEKTDYPRLALFDHEQKLCKPSVTTVYIKNDEPYGPWKLFQETADGGGFGRGPATPPGQELTWLQWLYKELKVQKVVNIGSNELSPDGQYLQRYRPEMFLTCLRLWAQDKAAGSVQYLKTTEVLCRGNRQVPFQLAYFPTDILQRRVDRFLPPGAFFPWLWLDTEAATEAAPEAIPLQWKSFLSKVGVGTPSSDVGFALDMLKYFVEAVMDMANGNDVRIFELYEHISIELRGAKAEEARNQGKATAQIRKFFAENRCIYVPNISGKGCTWAFPNECVWKAPQPLVCKEALECLYKKDKNFANFKHLSGFFADTLEIGNCSLQILLDELRVLRMSECDDIDTISGIYAGLQAMKTPSFLVKDVVRNAFEDGALIYVPFDDDTSAWYKPSQCVWSSAARLRGRISLNDEYGKFEDLFVNLLGVRQVDLQMAVDELGEIARNPTATIEEVKESIQTVNSLLPSSSHPPSPQGVVDGRIFPIRTPSGMITVVSKAVEFFIADRESLRSAFQTKVKFLDFSLEEVVRLQPFLEWAGLESRYLSRCVSEMTSFHGGAANPTTNPERQIRNRGHALLRIAIHFNSPRVQGLNGPHHFYGMMKSAELYETNGISSDLVLSQDNVSHTVEGKIQTLHIDESRESLKVYVPQHKDDQEYIFTNVLSQRLFEWMMEHPVTHISGGSRDLIRDGTTATRDIMLAPISRLDRALDYNGISMIDIENTDENTVVAEPKSPSTPMRAAGESPEPTDSDSDLPQTPSTINAGLPIGPEGAGTPGRSRVPSSPSGRQQDAPSRRLSSSPSAARSGATPAPGGVTIREYVTLLNNVIEQGRRNIIPTRGAFDMSLLQSRIPGAAGSTNWGLGSLPPLERDLKVGAAGELYVFELLVNLNQPRSLPGFSRANWQSNIRSHVTVHPEYRTMPPWLGRETSDLVYNDTEGALTECLIDRGFLSGVLGRGHDRSTSWK
ncbi:hypothetical protein PG993_007043 [Apiospora rasikravindrae]|uniref:Uncharacterized protein n=1 Tax=Apiospora rasikravindrae TaxID=990691 RepID=A0ABR1SWQ2_9PEZI